MRSKIAINQGFSSEKHSTAMVTGLFFAMGMQNALVTVVSGSIVRTTHLTGLFTDVGIETAMLLRKKALRPLTRSLVLHLLFLVFFWVDC